MLLVDTNHFPALGDHKSNDDRRDRTIVVVVGCGGAVRGDVRSHDDFHLVCCLFCCCVYIRDPPQNHTVVSDPARTMRLIIGLPHPSNCRPISVSWDRRTVCVCVCVGVGAAGFSRFILTLL